MKYLVCDVWGKALESFRTEESRNKWLKRYCYFDGISWLVYDLSRFPHKMTSRVIHTCEE